MNILIKYIIGEERTINNTYDSISNIGVNLLYTLSTRDFSNTQKDNKNIIENLQENF